MAKRKSKSKSYNQRRSHRPVGRGYLTPTASLLPRQNIIQNFDNRFFSFPITTLPRAPITRYGARTAIQPIVKKGKSLHARYQIIAPRQTLICVRRQTRKEVLFANRKAGRHLGIRKMRRNATSRFSC